MRLIQQYNLAKKYSGVLSWEGAPFEGGRQYTVQNLASLMTAARELQRIPSLSDAADELIASLPFSSNAAVMLTSVSYSPIKKRVERLQFLTQELLLLLRPLISKEEESTIYLNIPDLKSLKDLSGFINDITKNLDQIFTTKLTTRYSFDFQAVEKGSDWLVLFLVANEMRANYKNVSDFMSFIVYCVEYYGLYEQFSKLLDMIGGNPHNPEAKEELKNSKKILENNMAESQREAVIDKILKLSPLAEGAALDYEDKIRIGTAVYNIGQIFKEKTQIEISGLLEERNGGEINTKIEKLKITRTRSVELLPKPNTDEKE